MGCQWKSNWFLLFWLFYPYPMFVDKHFVCWTNASACWNVAWLIRCLEWKKNILLDATVRRGEINCRQVKFCLFYCHRMVVVRPFRPFNITPSVRLAVDFSACISIYFTAFGIRFLKCSDDNRKKNRCAKPEDRKLPSCAALLKGWDEVCCVVAKWALSGTESWIFHTWTGTILLWAKLVVKHCGVLLSMQFVWLQNEVKPYRAAQFELHHFAFISSVSFVFWKLFQNQKFFLSTACVARRYCDSEDCGPGAEDWMHFTCASLSSSDGFEQFALVFLWEQFSRFQVAPFEEMFRWVLIQWKRVCGSFSENKSIE